MPDSYKTFWWNVHKKSSYKLYTGYCKLLPLTFFAIIFYIVSNGIFIHSYDSVVAAKAVDEHREIMLITTEGILIRMEVADISVLGRITSGV